MASAIRNQQRIQEWATSEIPSFMNHITRQSSQRMVKSMKTILKKLNDGSNRSTYTKACIKHVLSGSAKLLQFLRVNLHNQNLPHQFGEDMLKLIYDMMVEMSPSQIIQAKDLNIEEDLPFIISGISDYQSYMQEGNFSNLCSTNITRYERYSHKIRQSIFQFARHNYYLLKNDWSFKHLTYFKYQANNPSTFELARNETAPTEFDQNCLSYKFTYEYLYNSEPPVDSLQQSGVIGNSGTGEIFLLKCVDPTNIEEYYPHISTVLNKFCDEILDLRATGNSLTDSEICYILKFITAFNISLRFINQHYEHSQYITPIIGVMSEYSRKMLDILLNIRTTEIGSVKEKFTTKALIENLIVSSGYSNSEGVINLKDICFAFDNMKDRAMAMHVIIYQNITGNLDTANATVDQFTFNDYEEESSPDEVQSREFQLPADDYLPVREALLPDQHLTKENLQMWLSKFSGAHTITDYLSRFDQTCTICRSSWTSSSDVGILPCDHIFCLDCIKAWFSPRSTCKT